MGRGCFFVKKSENGGCFVKKSGKCFFFVKKWTFPQRRVHYVQYQYFYFTFYLFGGAYAPNAPPAYCTLPSACVFMKTV